MVFYILVLHRWRYSFGVWSDQAYQESKAIAYPQGCRLGG